MQAGYSSRLKAARARRHLKLRAARPKVSPLAPVGGFPDLPVVAGLTLSAGRAAVRYKNRDDVMLACMAPGTTVAGVTTRSGTRAAPVLDCERKLASSLHPDAPAAFLVNSGNANAFTGDNGHTSVAAVSAAVSRTTGIPEERVFTASTGVIGEPLPHDRIIRVLSAMKGDLVPGQFEPAARAIMTTDTFPKGAGQVLEIDGQSVAISGFAKGSGMIAPDMGTMLVYLFTDAKIAVQDLSKLVKDLTDRSFNAITVDSDTSTSDTLLMGATGQGPTVSPATPGWDAFRTALQGVMTDLAHQVVRDGEGATKFLQVTVTGAETEAEAKQAALAIANSPLVKTAVAGEDPNWGRVVMAVGKSGAKANRDTLSIWFGPNLVAENGWVSPDYKEEIGARYMKQQDLELRVDLGIGSETATVWTCDLTHGYITINADYRS